jgi:hypothetical protein
MTALAMAGGVARAEAPGGGDLDDPKLARRLKSRIALPSAEIGGGPTTGTSIAPTVPSPDVLAAESAPGPAPAPTPGSTTTISSRPAPGPWWSGEGRTATLQLAYRRFSFVQIGATDPGSTSGAAISEPFDSLSLDLYPVSRLIRFGLSTQYGWQSGRFNSGSGDYFIAQSVSLGIQRPGPWVTPFVEGLAGAGYMRRFQFDRTIPTAYWQFGIDAGAQLFVASHGFVSAAIGYLHPVNGFAKQQSFASLYVDTWSFKLGFGL